MAILRYPVLFSWMLLLGLCFACAPSAARAQQGSTTIDPLAISVTPEAPIPEAQTTISIESSTIDLNAAEMSWSVDGTVVKEGSSVKSFTFTMGKGGQQTTVNLTVKPKLGSAFTRTFTFHPGSVTLLWEASTYVPALYPGKALYSPGADIRIMAIPNIADISGAPIDASRLVFKWRINDEAFADKSGRGKDTLDLTGSQLHDGELVTVDVVRPDGTTGAEGTIGIPSTDPLIRFYVRDPLRGILYSEALAGQKRLTETETTVVAEPYFISGRTRAQTGFTYEWQLNGQRVASQGGDPLMLTLRQSSGQSGVANLSFTLQNTDLSKLLQQASASLQLLLGDASSAHTFGL